MNRNFASFAFWAGVAAVLSGCMTPGGKAAARGDAAQLQRILAQPDHGHEDSGQLLYYSYESDCVDCARLVLNGLTPPVVYLAGAALGGHEKMARLFIEKGAEPTAAMSWIESHPDGFLNFDRVTSEEVEAARSLFEKIAGESESTADDEASASVPEEKNSADDQDAAETKPQPSKLTPDFHQAERPNDYALIIGVEKYDSLPAASYAEGDAATAADFVRAMGVPARNVVTLTNSHATRSGIVKQLENWLAKNTDETSTVYFYFSGHGAPDPATGQAYLVPFDGDPQYLAETAYPLKRLYEKLGALKAKRTIVMIDSCFSGAGGRSVLARGARPLVSNIDTGFNSAVGNNIAVLTASGANQISGTNDEKGHGLFTYYLFNGLNGAAADGSGQVTLQSLYNYLKPKVMDDARRANGDQTPELKANQAFSSAVLRGK